MPTIKKTVGQITLKVLTDVKSTTYYYLLQSSMAPAPSTPTTNPPGGGWSTTEPEFFAYIPTQDTSIFPGKDYYTRSGSAGDYTYTIVSNPTGNPSTNSYYEKVYGDTRSLYVTVQTFYTDNTFEYSTPSLSSSYEAAKEAYNRAKTALDLAGDSKQYFWEQPNGYSASVPAGVYVTHIPQNQFKSNPAQGNILIQDTGITIRNGAISLASLTGSALNFYNPSTHQTNATLSSGGLVLSKGGINAGSYSSSATDANQNFVYLSSENYGIEVKIGDSLATKNDWRQIIGNKFGVDKAGNLYAAGAHVDGDIIAQSLTIGSGSNAYDGMAAINISGYDIEIISDSTGVVDSDNTTYLYPHLYHNGVEVTTGVNYSHFIWYQDGVEPGTAGDANNQGRYLATYGHNYRVTYDFDDGAVSGGTQVQTRTIDPSKYITKINDYGITIHPEIWEDESSYIQLTGSGMELFNSNGDSVAQYGSTIRIGKSTENHLEINNNGVSILNNTDSLANFGSTARIGLNNSSRFLINNSSLQAYDNNNNKYFEVNSNGLTWGNNTAATVADLANKADFSDVEDAAKTATNNLIDINSRQGVVIKSIRGSYNTGSETDNYIQINSDKVSFYKTGIEKVQLTSENLIIGDSLNYIDVNANGMQIYKSNINVANFGDSIRIGREETGYTRIYLDPTSRSDGKINAWRILSPNDSVVQSVAFDGEVTANQNIVKDYDENIYQVGNQGSKTNLLTTSVNSKTVSISVGELIDSVNDTNVSLILTSKAYSDWQECFYLPGDSYHWTFTNHSFNFVKGVSSLQTKNFIEAKDDLDLGTEGITRTITVNYDGNNTFMITSTAQKTSSSDESNYYIVNTFISSASFTKSGVLVPFNEFSGYTRMNSTGVGTTFIGLDVDKNANISTLASTGEDKDLFNIIRKLNLYDKIIAGNITIEPKRTRIGVGNRNFPSPATLVATTVPEGLDVTWSSNDEDYITVTQNGVITAHGTFSPIDPVIVTASTVFQGITYTATCEVFVENIG